MRSLSYGALMLLLLQAQFSLAEATVTVVEKPSFTTTLAQHEATKTPQITSKTSPTTFSTSTVQATSSQAGYGYAASGSPNSDNGIDVEGGASGPDTGSFSLSTGGLIAVIVVVVAVAIFGVVSVVLYVVAKRRNWNVRASIKRASRRLTGRRDVPTRSVADRRKRSGVVAGSRQPGTTLAHPPGHKHGLAVEIKDVEKGTSGSNAPKKTRENTWIQRLWGNDWK